MTARPSMPATRLCLASRALYDAAGPSLTLPTLSILVALQSVARPAIPHTSREEGRKQHSRPSLMAFAPCTARLCTILACHGPQPRPVPPAREKNASPRNKITPPPQTFGLCGGVLCKAGGGCKAGFRYAIGQLGYDKGCCNDCNRLQAYAILLHARCAFEQCNSLQ